MDITLLFFKYSETSIFQRTPFLFEYETEMERFLTGIECENISFEMRDFLSKCLEVFIKFSKICLSILIN